MSADPGTGDGGERTAPPSDRTRLRRKPSRGRYGRATIDAILDAAIVGYVGWVRAGQPYVTPVNVWRAGDRLLWHASVGSGMGTELDGQPVCVTVSHVDSLVLARSATNHSLDYRSVMALGTAHRLTADDEIDAALEGLVESLFPGRWAGLRPMTDAERRATAVLWIDLSEASAKVRDSGLIEDPGDETWPAWGGVIPVRMVRGQPEPDGFVPDGMAAPEARLP
ncbi:MAG TPA: pyridoxamine 5'-phosphate oxidase family protein [Candidatus Limnocylindrales bacterium]|nr:pyridoxamine 5'-phosphate oxidase family protein [Candidatus Limnocylindrales bacterium]